MPISFQQWSSDSIFGVCSRCGETVNTMYANEHIKNKHPHEREYEMSTAAWCDPGDHAFKRDIPGSQSGTMTIRDENGIPQTVNYDACPDHAFGARGQQSIQGTGPKGA